MYFDTQVKINEVAATFVKEIKYSPNYFSFGSGKRHPETLKDLGFAGFKILYPINSADKHDEIMSLLGASYFRVVGKGQVYGHSARGMVIDTALPSGEEFPRFHEFWVERPKPGDMLLVIYALLDSPRITGAYRFVVYPGRDTIVDLESKVFLRHKVGKLGIARLTSMFLFGSSQPSPPLNYRPALDDSNGLSIHAGNGELIWRQLNNSKHLSVSTFTVEILKGFGLLQRGRHFENYQDLDDRYDLRPSAWIEPRGDWGKGSVELVEIPIADETNNKIVSLWTPEVLPDIKTPLALNYRLRFTRNEDKLQLQGIAYVSQTFRATGEVKQSNLIHEPEGRVALLVDLVGPRLKGLDASAPVAS